MTELLSQLLHLIGSDSTLITFHDKRFKNLTNKKTIANYHLMSRDSSDRLKF